MIASIKIIGRKDKITMNGEIPIYLRFIKERKTSYISTGVKVPEQHWDVLHNRVKQSYPNSVRQNHYLNHLRLKYENLSFKEETNESVISIKDLKNRLTLKNSGNFFTVCEDLISKYKEENKIGTVAKATSIKRKLEVYTKSRNLNFSDITVQFLERYESYLRNNLLNKINTVHKDFKFIRRVINEAYRKGLIDYNLNPFNRYKIRTEKTNRTYLTHAELKSIEDAKCKTRKQQLARDMFVFSAYTGGIRISDVLLLKCKNFDGCNIHFCIQKSGNQLSIKIPIRPLHIIISYTKGKKPNDFIFPCLNPSLDTNDPISVDKAIASASTFVNKHLKDIAEIAEITKPLSFHIARHTWATLALQKGISLDKVSKLMGHASVRETQIYAKIMSEELDKAMEVFNQ
jgi:integrase/recombinase XerD